MYSLKDINTLSKCEVFSLEETQKIMSLDLPKVTSDSNKKKFMAHNKETYYLAMNTWYWLIKDCGYDRLAEYVCDSIRARGLVDTIDMCCSAATSLLAGGEVHAVFRLVDINVETATPTDIQAVLQALRYLKRFSLTDTDVSDRKQLSAFYGYDSVCHVDGDPIWFDEVFRYAIRCLVGNKAPEVGSVRYFGPGAATDACTCGFCKEATRRANVLTSDGELSVSNSRFFDLAREDMVLPITCSDSVLVDMSYHKEPFSDDYYKCLRAELAKLTKTEVDLIVRGYGYIKIHHYGVYPLTVYRVQLVPKQYNKKRLISNSNVVTTWNSMQLRGELLAAERSSSYHWNMLRKPDNSFRRWYRNRMHRYALEGSSREFHFHRYATIDSSHASDSVLKRHIRDFWPQEWADHIIPYLPTAFLTEKGKLVPMAMAAPMGHGATFELEKIVFSALCLASVFYINWCDNCDIFYDAYDSWYVFGDDVIIDERYVETFLWALNHYGFEPNKDKSFWEGRVTRFNYRESCGREFIDGKEVTSLYFPRHSMDAEFVEHDWWHDVYATRDSSIMSLHNRFVKYSPAVGIERCMENAARFTHLYIKERVFADAIFTDPSVPWATDNMLLGYQDTVRVTQAPTAVGERITYQKVGEKKGVSFAAAASTDPKALEPGEWNALHLTAVVEPFKTTSDQTWYVTKVTCEVDLTKDRPYFTTCQPKLVVTKRGSKVTCICHNMDERTIRYDESVLLYEDYLVNGPQYADKIDRKLHVSTRRTRTSLKGYRIPKMVNRF